MAIQGMQWTSQALPPWLESLVKRAGEQSQILMDHSLNPANYPVYNQPRVAPENQDIQRSYELGRQTGLYKPYLDRADQFNQQGGRTFPENVGAYMNPYTQHVLNNMEHRTNRNFQQNVVPALAATFSNLGQYGGTHHNRLVQRAQQDLQESLQRQQYEALNHAYEQAGKQFSIDTAGQREAGNQAAQLGKFAQAGNLADVATLQEQGRAQQAQQQRGLDTSHEEFLRQKNYPGQALARHAAIIQGLPHSGQTLGASSQRDSPESRVNTAGQIGSLAGQLYGAQKAFGMKKGGPVKKKTRKIPFGVSALSFELNKKKDVK